MVASSRSDFQLLSALPLKKGIRIGTVTEAAAVTKNAEILTGSLTRDTMMRELDNVPDSSKHVHVFAGDVFSLSADDTDKIRKCKAHVLVPVCRCDV